MSYSQKGFYPLDNLLDILLHIFNLLTLELQAYFWLVALAYFFCQLTKDLALDVLRDFLLIVASFLQTVEKLGVVAAEKHNQLEPSLRKEVAGVKFQNDTATLGHEWFQLIADHVDIKFRHVKLLIPLFVKFLCANHLCQFNVLKALELVLFWELVLQQRTQRCLAHTWCSGHKDVRQ